MSPRLLAALLAVAMTLAPTAHAHFPMILPSMDIVESDGPREIALDLLFAHPFEAQGMDMDKPVRFGVVAGGQETDLLPSLEPKIALGHKGWAASFAPTRPADHVFFVEPAPYWEEAEDCFIVHYTKAVVSAFGAEEGWDEEIGLKIEIVPLARPYGLYAGNLFSGVVKREGEPLSDATVEVEFFNRDRSVTAPADAFITQIVKTDANGVFHYAIPWAGWWGFAALSEDDRTIEKDGEAKPVEIGGVIWVQARAPGAATAR